MGLQQEKLRYSLSSTQQGMLFFSLAEPEAGYYIEQISGRFADSIDVTLFEEAWQFVIAKHEALRAAFSFPPQGKPFQSFSEAVPFSLVFREVASLDADEQEQIWQAFLDSEKSKSFDLEKPPLMRVALFQFAEDDYRFVWTFHHAILDGRAFEVVLEDCIEAYQALSTGQMPPVENQASFSEYLEWLEKSDFAASKKYWQKRLAGFTAHRLPLAKERGVALGENHQTEKYTQLLSSSLLERLRELAAVHEVTLNTLLQAAWAVVLVRCGGGETVTFGCTRACRHFAVEGSERMAGVLINSLPLCVTVGGELPVTEWLQQLRGNWLELRKHEHTPLEQIRDYCGLSSSVNLFDSLLIFEGYERTERLQQITSKLGGVDFSIWGKVNFPLVVTVYEGEGLSLNFHYKKEVFTADSIHKIAHYVESVLNSLLQHAKHGRVAELQIASTQEQQQWLISACGATVPLERGVSVHGDFEAQVIRSPEACAVSDGEVDLTYAELNLRANQWAHYLIAEGIQPGARVGLYVERSLAFCVGVLAVLKAGGTYVPIDVSFPVSRALSLLEDAEVSCLITQSEFASAFENQNFTVVATDDSTLPGESCGKENPSLALSEAALAYINFTSGSTGRANGVLVKHRGVVNHGRAMARLFDLVEGDRTLQISNLSFDFVTEEIFPAWFSGATVMLGEANMLTSAEHFFQHCEALGVTVLGVPTALWHTLVEGLKTADTWLAPSLKLLVVGGERASAQAYCHWAKCVPEHIRWMNTYGPTEATVTALYYEAKAGDADCFATREIPIGKPVENVCAYNLDPSGAPVSPGATGELYLGGAGVAQGYCNNAEKSAAHFVADSFDESESALLFRTGDFVRQNEDGVFEFVGRKDSQVKVNGYRVEPGEIEALLEQQENVSQSVVVARDSEVGGKELIAYCVPKSLNGELAAELRSSLLERLPNAIVPKHYVLLEAFPLTANGKVDRKQLPEPSANAKQPQAESGLPRNQLEVRIKLIWEELLNQQGFGIYDDFYQLGGDSLRAIQLFVEIEKRFGIKLSAQALLELTTVADLAVVIQAQNGGAMAASDIPLIGLRNLEHLYRNGLSLEGQRVGQQKLFRCIRKAKTAKRILFSLGSHFNPTFDQIESDATLYCTPNSYYPIEEPEQYIERVSSLFAEEIAVLQPEGDIYLVGYCFEALVAYAVAQHLKEKGRNVAWLGMVDRPFPKPFERGLIPQAIRQYCRFMTHSRHHRAMMRGMGMVSRIGYLWKGGSQALKNLVVSKQLMRVERPEDDPWHTAVLRSMYAAMLAYRLEAWPGSVSFIFHETLTAPERWLHLRAWKPFIQNCSSVDVISGRDHSSLKHEKVTQKELAELFEKALFREK